MDFKQQSTFPCPICKSMNTVHCQYANNWKCNDCGVHFKLYNLEEVSKIK
ncbi:MAG: hypothetical protein WC758_07650 [Candidatus Woesearchaeota archaeon]|jgi:ribosomal protein L37AE/L43A